jgi:DNA-binding response OmpR family regulator
VGLRAEGRTRTVDSHARRLRIKLCANADGRWIGNVWGVGYRLTPLDPNEEGERAA